MLQADGFGCISSMLFFPFTGLILEVHNLELHAQGSTEWPNVTSSLTLKIRSVGGQCAVDVFVCHFTLIL